MNTIWGLVAIGSFIYCVIQNKWIQVEPIRVEVKGLPKDLEGFKIVHLSDLHLPRSALKIDKLIELVQGQAPDLIVLTGDLIDRAATIQISGLKELCAGLVKIAAVYAVTGNHEQSSNQLGKWEQILIESGVQFVDNDYQILKIGSVNMAVMGLEDHEWYETQFLNQIAVKESHYRILLVHRPLLWKQDYPHLKQLRPDLVLNGHEHGGIIRIPFVGGLVSHDQGLFPKYTSGLYRDHHLMSTVISRGLGGTLIPIRVHNRPHLPVITLTRA